MPKVCYKTFNFRRETETIIKKADEIINQCKAEEVE